MSRIVIARPRTRASGEEPFIRDVASDGMPYYGEISPFTHNRSLKNRWLLTSSIAGLFGAMVIGGAFFFTYESKQIAVANTDGGTRLSSRNPQKILIDNKSDQTERLIGDVPVLGGKNVTDRSTPGKQYTNVVVTFGHSELKSAPSPKTAAAAKGNGLSGTPNNDETSGSQDNEVNLTSQQAQASSSAAVLGTINLGDKFSSFMGFKTDKPVVVANAPVNFDVNSTETIAAANTTLVTKRESVNKSTKIPYQTVSISPGDTLINILTDHGAFYDDALRIVATLQSGLGTAKLKEGQKVTFALAVAERNGSKVLVPHTLELATGKNKRLTVKRNELGKYALLNHAPANTKDERFHAQAKIKKSLYLAARIQGIPDKIIVDMMRIHAYDVDFQREVRVGDSFEVFYGDEKTLRKSKSGTVLFSSLILSGNSKSYYRFKTTDDKIVDYYDQNGRSAKKFLMRTPLNGARLSSRFGMRRHPILRYSRMHRGVDFAAPYGTPIKAAGNGIIDKKGGAGGYGNYIRIRHANGYKTAYGHMSRYAPGIRRGKRIRQGEVIGFVGSTGRSTGNHLHYEVWVKGKAVNPMRVKVPTGRQLSGKMLARFKKHKAKIDTLRRTAPVATRVAAAREAQRDGIN